MLLNLTYLAVPFWLDKTAKIGVIRGFPRMWLVLARIANERVIS
jgi:hypothetical protein